jgi:hypothetical protein
MILTAIVGGGILGYLRYFKREISSLTKFPEIKKPEKVVGEETANWKTYRNEEYGFEFDYPKEWGSIKLESQQNNDVYIFNSSNEKIDKIFYFKSQDVIAFITEGREYNLGDCNVWAGGRGYEQVLKILYPTKEIRTIFTTNVENIETCAQAYWIGSVSLSPNKEYIAFVISGYEWSNPILINLNSGLNILSPYPEIDFRNPYEEVFWPSSNKVLAIISHSCAIATCSGIDALFVSDYGNPEKLNEVLAIDYNDALCGSSFKNVYFKNDDKLLFSLILRKSEYKERKASCAEEKIINYEYTIKTKELKEIK